MYRFKVLDTASGLDFVFDFPTQKDFLQAWCEFVRSHADYDSDIFLEPDGTFVFALLVD